MSSNDSGFGGALLFATGAVIGAALGVLFAPRAGSETREQLTDWLRDRREKGEELLHKVKDEALTKKDAFMSAAKAAKQAYSDAV